MWPGRKGPAFFNTAETGFRAFATVRPVVLRTFHLIGRSHGNTFLLAPVALTIR
ncbi:MAG TPA: hypothetical protein VHK69_10450 [Chitinophagaceae bacterium]|nr:hypothetical protein [Chitinophagaceae bacterium]